jgi:mRNA interferase MazF
LAEIARAAAEPDDDAVAMAEEALPFDNEALGLMERTARETAPPRYRRPRLPEKGLMRRGEAWVANLNPSRGAETGKVRPVVILQADFLIAQGEPTVIVLPLTTQVRPSNAPLRVTVPARDRLRQDCQVMPEQPRTLDRARLLNGPLTRLTAAEMGAVEKSFLAVVGMYR